jgi:hypothetical protein
VDISSSAYTLLLLTSTTSDINLHPKPHKACPQLDSRKAYNHSKRQKKAVKTLQSTNKHSYHQKSGHHTTI